MNFIVIFFAFMLLCLDSGRGEGFFSKFLGRKKSESDYVNDESVNVCETIRVMPRIALAIVGGSPMQNKISAPYIAAIGHRSSDGTVSWFCGGSLISSKDVLTAAHCLISRNATLVRVGSFSARKSLTENDYEISETIIHPSYKITESYHDIAVVKIKNKISFTENIKPVCLPQNDRERYERERARVVGWGAEEFGGEGTQKLQQVEVEVFSNSDCETAYKNSTIALKIFPRGIQRQQLCAGSFRGGKDACQGDSGGPLVLTDDGGIIRQIGVVSTGAGCGFKQYPGVYTRVSSYYDWIQEQIKKGDSNKEVMAGLKKPDSRDSSNGNERYSQYRKGTSHDRPSPNHLITSMNQRKQNKKYQSREQNSAEMSHYNQPTESLYASETPKSSYSGSQASSRPFHSCLLSQQSQSSFASNSNHSSYSSMMSQSQQSLDAYPSRQRRLTSRSSTKSSKHVQLQSFGNNLLTPSQYSSHPTQTPQTSYISNSRQPISSQISQSMYQSNFQQPPSQISEPLFQSPSLSQVSSTSYQSGSQQLSSQKSELLHQSNFQQPSSSFQISQPSYQSPSSSQIPQSAYQSNSEQSSQISHISQLSYQSNV